jgi:beta-lactamase superfamily II metal-dependent hydrolase
MILTLDVRRARKGDCLLLHYGTKAKPKLMLIDGGPSSVYKPQLRPRLDEIRAARGLADGDSLAVDVVMISHIDDDHIKGILDLTKELSNQQRDGEPQYLTSKTLWHNSFDDLLKTTPKELSEAGFGPAQATAALDLALDTGEHTTMHVLASVPQGRTLRDDAAFLRDNGHGWKVNDLSSGKLILADKKTKAQKIDGGLSITVVGPMLPELQELQKEHDKYLQAKKKGEAAAASLLAAYVDESVSNLSSLVLLVEVDKKRILLTGDARGDKILEGLKLTGLLGTGASAKLEVDVMKVPHHGSANNVEGDFFKKVVADHYVFSGDGEHGNPEREAVEMLLEARPDDSFTMYFTYPIDEIDVERKADWAKEQAKEKKKLAAQKKKVPKPKKLTVVRPNWNASAHSLAALLKKDDPDLHKIVVIEADGEGQLIELLDPIKF